MSTPNISIIVPALNEESNIAPIFERLSKILEKENYEVIFVDDGSSDATADVISNLSKKYPQIKGISFSRNFGHQAALKAGLDYAQGECVISIDCDLEHPPEYLPKMVELWRGGADVVVSKREQSLRLPFLKRWSSKLFYSLLKIISDVPIEPGTADFRLLDRKVVNACKALTENELFWRGLIPWLGFKTKVLSYQQSHRKHGSSKYSFAKMAKLSMAGITSFSVRPLYLSLYLGVLFASSSFLYLVYAVGIKFFTHQSVSGWASLIASVLLIGGVQLCILGVMGIYIGKLFVQAKGRPTYVVRQTISISNSERELKKAG